MPDKEAEEGRKRRRERGREGGRERGREREKEGGKEREGGRKRDLSIKSIHNHIKDILTAFTGKYQNMS